jgi:hypothetical protein
MYILHFNLFFLNSSIQNNYFLNEKNAYLKKYLILKNKDYYNNISLINREKLDILFLFGKNNNLTSIDKIFYKSNYNFGNLLANLNKLIFYCEIIGCKSILLDKNSFWFLKNKIIIPLNNMTIEVGDYNNSYYYFDDSQSLFFSIFEFKPEIRINYLREEIISNLPKINISKNDLYIHIRSGDIFTKVNIYYSQPPLCFYQKILSNFLFKKVFLISLDNNNPVIEKLINQFSNIIYNKNSISYDISQLMNAFNIVGSISSFLYLIIQLNNHLEFLWDYNIYKTSEKIYLYHYDLYKYPHNNFTLYRMEPSYKYNNKMYIWKNNKIQKKLMIKEKCNYYFSIINKEI